MIKMMKNSRSDLVIGFMSIINLLPSSVSEHLSSYLSRLFSSLRDTYGTRFSRPSFLAASQFHRASSFSSFQTFSVLSFSLAF